MLVAFNVKGDPKHHAVEVDTKSFREAIITVKNVYQENMKPLERCFAVIEGGKKSTPVPVLDLPPMLA